MDLNHILILFDLHLLIFCKRRSMWWWPHTFDVVTRWNIEMAMIREFYVLNDQCYKFTFIW